MVRDKNGSYKLEVPTLPQALVGEDGEELAELAPEDGGFVSSDLTGCDKESMFFFGAMIFSTVKYSLLILDSRVRGGSGGDDGSAPDQTIER